MVYGYLVWGLMPPGPKQSLLLLLLAALEGTDPPLHALLLGHLFGRRSVNTAPFALKLGHRRRMDPMATCFAKQYTFRLYIHHLAL